MTNILRVQNGACKTCKLGLLSQQQSTEQLETLIKFLSQWFCLSAEEEVSDILIHLIDAKLLKEIEFPSEIV